MSNLDPVEQALVNKYELEAFVNYFFNGQLERWVPGISYCLLDDEHMQRYNLAKDLVKDKVVLDIACGVGRGSYELATAGGAKQVIGGDINRNSLAYATAKYKSQNLSYQYIDATAFNNADFFDFVVSFETIEHLSRYDQFLANIHSSLKIGGQLLISTPISKKSIDTSPANCFHVQEWGCSEFQKLIRASFDIKKVFVQYYKPHSLYKRVLWSLKGRIKQFFEVPNPGTNFAKYLSIQLKELEPGVMDSKPPVKGYQIILATKIK